MDTNNLSAAFSGLVDLASERMGGSVISASDEFFAPKENLLKPGRGIFIPDKYTERGKWMDGWETRRRRDGKNDWCTVRLGCPGVIHGVDIDTNHFIGNSPLYAAIFGLNTEGSASSRLPGPKDTRWIQILGKSPLQAGSQNLFSISSEYRWTHLLLWIYPDGGVARLRVYGDVMPEPGRFRKHKRFDLAAIENGGMVVAASDMFFGRKENLIMPGRAKSMADGWETRRRRGPGHDWAIVRLGQPGNISGIEVDTNHFKGNFPERCSIDVLHAPGSDVDALNSHTLKWKTILSEHKLRPHHRHIFARVLKKSGPVTHVRLNIYPDGGVSRLRVYGTIS